MRTALGLLACLCMSCGYHIAGRADLLPGNLRTIAIAPFQNATTRYKLAEALPAAISRELISRTRYQVTTDLDQADAILHGAIVNYFAYPTVFDPRSGRAAAVQVVVLLDIRLIERATGRLLYQRTGWQVQERYEISADQAAYIEESDAALDRLSREVARAVVSGLLEGF